MSILAKYLGVLGGREDVIKLLLQGLPLSQRPIRLLLVHKDDILQDGLHPTLSQDGIKHCRLSVSCPLIPILWSH